MIVAVVLQLILASVASSTFSTLARVVVSFASSVRSMRRGLIDECCVVWIRMFPARVVLWFVWRLELRFSVGDAVGISRGVTCSG